MDHIPREAVVSLVLVIAKSSGRGLLQAALLGLLLAVNLSELLVAEPAHFWISRLDNGPQGPSVPTISGASGVAQSIFIWAQPATDHAGTYHPQDNPFKVLKNFSLDLVTFAPTLDFLDTNIIVYNSGRFQAVNDSNSVPPLTSAYSEQEIINESRLDQIAGIKGFSISSGQGTGIGPTCSGDSNCVTTSGVPAWLIARVDLRTVQSSSLAELYLQIGDNGMNHLAANGSLENSSLTTVFFGSDSVPAYEYHAGSYVDQQFVVHKFGDRGITLSGDDTPDLIVQPSIAGDFNRDDRVDAADYVVWRKGVGTNHLPTEFDLWRMHFGETTGSGAANGVASIPEPPISLLALICLWLVPRQGRDSSRLLAAVPFHH